MFLRTSIVASHSSQENSTIIWLDILPRLSDVKIRARPELQAPGTLSIAYFGGVVRIGFRKAMLMATFDRIAPEVLFNNPR